MFKGSSKSLQVQGCPPIFRTIAGMVMIWCGMVVTSFALIPMNESVDLSFTLIHDFNTNSISDPYDDDTDHDGIADLWETELFGNLTTASEGSDFDEDGFTDAQEYKAGSNPKDEYSHLQVEFVQKGAGGGMTIGWESSGNIFPYPRSYDVQFVDALPGFLTGNPVTLATNVPSDGASTTLSFPQETTPSKQRFYRIQLHER